MRIQFALITLILLLLSSCKTSTHALNTPYAEPAPPVEVPSIDVDIDCDYDPDTDELTNCVILESNNE